MSTTKRNKRFSKLYLAQKLWKLDQVLRKEYWVRSGKPYDSTNGTSQIPVDNTAAAVIYGQIQMIKQLYEDYQLGKATGFYLEE
jgi:hypothetical protein